MTQQELQQSSSWVSKLISVRVRLIPIVIFSAVLLLSVKIVSFWDTFQASLEVSSPVKAAAKPQNESPKKADMPKPVSKKVPQRGGEKPFDPLDLTAAEIKVLQSLAKRRDQIKLREKELQSKESVLTAVEARLDSKLNELKDVKDKIEDAMNKDDEKQKTKLKRLVKIYEGMKPKDAAKIMQDLHLELVVRIFEQMKEKSGSAIMAKMDIEAARLITAKLAQRRRLAQILDEQKAQAQQPAEG